MKLQLTNSIIKQYVDQGSVEANRHRDLPLTIYNYSRECQFEQKWDDITLACRGLILDDDDVIVARGFNKFFNYEEVEHKDEIPVHDEYVYVQEKMDGSLGILFNYDDRWHMASRGSFHSDQAREGLRIVTSKYDLTKFHKKLTYLCEIIYPSNRIVIDYGEEKVTFLSAVMDGRELNWQNANAMFRSSGILEEDIVPTQTSEISGDLFGHLKSKNEINKEGYVLRFHPSNYRVKIKFEEYVRLHKLLTDFSNIGVWECLMAGDDLGKYLESVPDEFDRWIKDWIRALKFAFVMKELDAKTILARLLYLPHYSKKEDALWIQENCPREYHGLVFLMLNGQDYDEVIWRMIRPKFQKPFWQSGNRDVADSTITK